MLRPPSSPETALSPDTLPLDPAFWSSLTHAHGRADDVPSMLRTLETARSGVDRDLAWEQLWSSLCHQGMIYSASYAAVPFVVDLARERPPSEQLLFWIFVATIAAEGEASDIPRALHGAYQAALVRARATVEASDWSRLDADERPWLVSALANLQGERAVARAVEGLIDGEIALACPACDGDVYVSVSQAPFVASNVNPEGGWRSQDLTRLTPRPDPRIDALLMFADEPLTPRLRGLASTVLCPTCEEAFPLLERA